MVRATSPGPVLFVQPRVGRHGKLFKCYKFRTMVTGSHALGSITTATDSRITDYGRILRRYKLDELPQLWNVFIGKMSFVGPRPDVPGYIDQLKGDDRQVLELLPGITGPATILFRNEEQLLEEFYDQKAFNDEIIYPEKVRINLKYLESASFWKDIGYIIATVMPFLLKRSGFARYIGIDYEAFHMRIKHKASDHKKL